MAKLFQVHGHGNTVYFVANTPNGDKICEVELKTDNTVATKDLLSPNGFKIYALQRLFSGVVNSEGKATETELAFVDDLKRVHRLSFSKDDENQTL